MLGDFGPYMALRLQIGGYGSYLILFVTTATNVYEFYYCDDLVSEPWLVAETDIPGDPDGYLEWYDLESGPGRGPTEDNRYFCAGYATDDDGDDLGAGYEVWVLNTSPDKADSDGDGVNDGAEDPDGDGRTTAEEYNSPAYTNYDSCTQGSSYPFSPDTDGDGVSDGPLVPPPWDLTSGPDAFPLDPAGAVDTDCDGMPDTLNTNFTSNSEPPLEEDLDDDNDGLPDTWEDQYGLDPKSAVGDDGAAGDPDGDGFTNLEEYNAGTDPTNKYSVPPLSMLRASGPDIVDSSNNVVLLRSVNVGGWLQWEQWMLMYRPRMWTNDWGKIYGIETNDQVDEATAREMLMSNVDICVTRLATNASAISGLTVQSPWPSASWLCDPSVKFLGGFGNGEWFCFSNVNFGAGVSNLTIALAVPANDAGKQIEVRLDGPGGPVQGTLTTKSTGPTESDYKYGCALTEQYLVISNLVGNQTVYFVGKSAGGDIGNVYRVRFFNSATNTARLFDTFRDNYFTTNDLDRIRDLGYNCIRLPYFHTLLEDDSVPYTYKISGWDRLDWVLAECAKRHMYCILDLHSTPGGQNPYHAGGYRDPFRNRMWLGEFYKDRTEKLWGEIAKRYSTNPVVAGYDLFNEPDSPRSNDTESAYQWGFSNNIVPMLTRLHTAIRSNDTQHILFVEGNMLYTNMWRGDYLWWPVDSTQRWTNICFEFHVYDRILYGLKNDNEDSWFITQKPICDTMIRAFTELREKRGVPVYVGEYAPWNEQNFDYWTRQMTANDIHWGHWNYRSWGWMDTNKPEEGKTLWGLDFRSKATTNTTHMPELVTDDFESLSNKLTQYVWTNYTDNAHLQDVAARHAGEPALSKGMCEFYLNTFSAPDSEGLGNGWPWRKLAVPTTNAAAFRVNSSHARIYVDTTPAVMRAESREEADARLRVNDSTGCRFSVDVVDLHVTNNLSGDDAAVTLSAARDSVTAPIRDYDTKAVIARLLYDQTDDSLTLKVYAKDGGTSTFGVEKAEVTGVTFVPSNTLVLLVNETNAVLSYGGAELANVSHGLDLGAWPDGAVCVVEAEDTSSVRTAYVELDNLQARRDDAAMDALFAEGFTDYPDGGEIRAETEFLSVEDYWAPSRRTGSFATNGAAFWIPKECPLGSKWGTWMNPRRDYQNDVRVPMTGNIVEVRAAYSSFTGGIAKICILPESFPTEIYNEYAGEALYLELELTNIVTTPYIHFTAYRHTGIDGSRTVIQGSTNLYVSGQLVSMQVGSANVRVYYGGTLVISNAHGVSSVTSTYADGAYPHFEVQNGWNTTNAYLLINDVLCRSLSDFAPPEE